MLRRSLFLFYFPSGHPTLSYVYCSFTDVSLISDFPQFLFFKHKLRVKLTGKFRFTLRIIIFYLRRLIVWRTFFVDVLWYLLVVLSVWTVSSCLLWQNIGSCDNDIFFQLFTPLSPAISRLPSMSHRLPTNFTVCCSSAIVKLLVAQ